VDLELESGEQVDVTLLHRPEHELDLTRAVLGFRPPQPGPDEELARAVAMAKAADVAVVVVGTNEEIETEGRDRTTLSLPGRQDELVRRVAEANPRTVVVVISGAPVALPWRDQVAATLLAPFGGQEQGPALADVLLGVSEAGGRLATTWAGQDADVPVWSTQPAAGVLPYAENLQIGYRAWMSTGRQPAYWFGHGLGYTTWTFDHLDAPTAVMAGEDATVRVRVANTGARPGKEVVQVYLSRPRTSVRRPPVWLAGFEVVLASAGEVREVEIPVAARAFQHWSVDDHDWRNEPGAFTVTVGPSAGDRPLSADILVMG
jgi:beta-glucosidase